MKKRAAKTPGTVPDNHPMVGIWEQEPGKKRRTTASYAISVKRGKFVVDGEAGDGGSEMRISKVRWNGSTLSFTSFYPRNQHTADVAFTVQGKRRLRCEVSGTYFGGEPFRLVEIWTQKADH